MPTIKVASYGDPIDTTGKHPPVSPGVRPREIVAWPEFTQITSLHGIKHAFDGRSRIRRTVWLLGVIAMASFLTYTISNLVIHYYQYPTRTEVGVSSVTAQTYPQVTICSMSPLSAEKLNGTSNPAGISTILAAMSPTGWRMETINFSLPEFKFANERHPKEHFLNLSNNMSTLLKFCRFEGKFFESCENIFETRMTEMGLCFTTRRMPHGKRVTKMTGSQRGLQISLNVAQEDYVHNSDMASGFKVMLHPSGTEPDIVNKGFLVPAGFTTYASTNVIDYKFLPFPYKAFDNTYCLDTKNAAFENLTTTDVYDETICFQECRTAFLVEECGCVDYMDRGNETICSLKEIYTCIRFAKLEFNNDKEDICSCGKPCESTDFDVKLSTAMYPSDLSIKHIEQSYPGFKVKRSNFADLRIFFENLVETRVHQSAIYSFDIILATLGGQMGIFLGASVLTLTEFIEYVILKIASCFCRPQQLLKKSGKQ